MGPAGSGQHTKAANQIAVAGATAAYTEALVYAQKAGLDPQKMLSAIGAGAAGSWQLTNMAPRALAGDFAPGFFIKHFIKDMKIVQEESRKSGVELEMLDTVLALYEKMAQQGLENDGTRTHQILSKVTSCNRKRQRFFKKCCRFLCSLTNREEKGKGGLKKFKKVSEKRVAGGKIEGVFEQFKRS